MLVMMNGKMYDDETGMEVRPGARGYENRDAHLKVRLKLSEREAVEECARRAGVKTSEWVREVLARAVRGK